MKIENLASAAAPAPRANWRQRLGAPAGMALVVLVAALASPAAQADLMVQFSYEGFRGSDVNFNVTGSGQVTVDDSVGPSFGLADVRDFSFMLTGVTAGFPTQVHWGLGNLEAFSLLLNVSGAVSDLTLRTAQVNPAHPQLMPQGFEVNGTTGNGGTRWDGGGLTGGRVTIDSVTAVAAAVPEPASIALVAVGLLAAAGSRRRQPAA